MSGTFPGVWRSIVGSLLLLSLVGCSVIKSYMAQQAFAGDWFPLQAPASLFKSEPPLPPGLSQPLSISHFVSFQRGDRVFSAIHQLEWNSDKIALAGLSHMGGPLFSLSFDGENLDINKSSLLPEMFHPGFVLRDYQLSLLPVSTLQSALADTEYRVEEDAYERRFYVANSPGNKLLVLKVVSTGAKINESLRAKSITLYDYRFDYQLKLEPFEAE